MSTVATETKPAAPAALPATNGVRMTPAQHRALGRIHATLGLSLLLAPLANWLWFRNVAATRAACYVCIPAILPIYPMAARRWKYYDKKRRAFVGSLLFGGVCNLAWCGGWLSGNPIATRWIVPEIPLVVSNLGAALLNGRNISNFFELPADSKLRKCLEYFTKNVPLTFGIVEGLGLVMMAVEFKLFSQRIGAR